MNKKLDTKIAEYLRDFAIFEKQCEDSNYTDTESAWTFMNDAANILRELKARRESKDHHFAVLDFAEARLMVRPIPSEMKAKDAPEDIASHFENELGLHLTDCEYMIGGFSIDIEQ